MHGTEITEFKHTPNNTTIKYVHRLAWVCIGLPGGVLLALVRIGLNWCALVFISVYWLRTGFAQAYTCVLLARVGRALFCP